MTKRASKATTFATLVETEPDPRPREMPPPYLPPIPDRPLFAPEEPPDPYAPCVNIAPTNITHCRVCKRPLRGRSCWKCHLSYCPCGTPTESAFLTICRACEVLEYRRLGIPY